MKSRVCQTNWYLKLFSRLKLARVRLSVVTWIWSQAECTQKCDSTREWRIERLENDRQSFLANGFYCGVWFGDWVWHDLENAKLLRFLKAVKKYLKIIFTNRKHHCLHSISHKVDKPDSRVVFILSSFEDEKIENRQAVKLFFIGLTKF